MTFVEFFAEYEARRPAQKGDYAGGMTRGDIDKIRADAAKHRRELAKIRAKQNVTSPAKA